MAEMRCKVERASVVVPSKLTMVAGERGFFPKPGIAMRRMRQCVLMK